jgi:hypothetical protein
LVLKDFAPQAADGSLSDFERLIAERCGCAARALSMLRSAARVAIYGQSRLEAAARSA